MTLLRHSGSHRRLVWAVEDTPRGALRLSAGTAYSAGLPTVGFDDRYRMFSRLLASLRVIGAFAVLVATIVVLTPSDPARAQAPPRPARFGAWLPGVLGTAADRDAFAFRLAAPGAVLLTLGDLPADYRLTLLAADGRVLAASDQDGTTFEELYRRLPAGRYVAEVSAAKGAVAAGRGYRLLIRPLADRVQILDAHPVVTGQLYAITGQLLNNTGSWRRYPRVTARFYGAGGRYLGESTALAAQTYLGPGQRGHFRVVADRPPGTVRYSLAVRAARSAAPARQVLTLRADLPYEVGGRTRHVGRVSGTATGEVHVHLLRYNRIGAFVEAGQATLPRLAGGDADRFEIEVPRYSYVRGERLAYSIG